MQKVIIDIYIENKLRPLATVEVEDVKKFDELFDLLEISNSVVKFGQVIFKKEAFRYATVTFK